MALLCIIRYINIFKNIYHRHINLYIREERYLIKINCNLNEFYIFLQFNS